MLALTQDIMSAWVEASADTTNEPNIETLQVGTESKNNMLRSVSLTEADSQWTNADLVSEAV